MIEDIAAGSNAVVLATSTGQVYTASLDRLANTNKKTEHGNGTVYRPKTIARCVGVE